MARVRNVELRMARVYKLVCKICGAEVVSEPKSSITAGEMAALDRQLVHFPGCSKPTRADGEIEAASVPLEPGQKLFRCPCGKAAIAAVSLAAAAAVVDLSLVSCEHCGATAKAFAEDS